MGIFFLNFDQLAQEGAPFAPHGVPGGANPKGLEDPAAAQEQYSAPGGKLFNMNFL